MRLLKPISPRLTGYLCILLGLLVFASDQVQAQRVTVSEAISLRKDDYYQILGRFQDNVLLSTDNGTSLELLRFDDRLRLLGKKELELDKRRGQILGLVPSGNSVVVIYQFSRKGESFLKLHRYDPAGILQDSATVLQFEAGALLPDCRMVVSEDNSKALIYFTERQTILSAYAIDLQKFTLLWDTKVAIDVYTFFKQFRTIIIDNKATMHLVLEKDNRRTREEPHQLELIQFKAGQESVFSRFVEMEGLKPQRFRFAYDNINNRLVGAGLSAEKQASRTTGLFCFFIEDALEGEFLLHRLPFDEEVSRKMTGNPEAYQKGLEDLEIKELLLRTDGGLVLLVEETRRLERNIAGQQFQFGPAGMRFIIDYYYEDVLVASIGPNGQTDWVEVLPKKQYSQDDDGLFSSVFIMQAPDQLRFLYNDEIAYENTVSSYRLDYKGKMDRTSVLSTDYQKLKLIFKDAVQSNVYEILVPSERSGKIRFVRIEF